MRTGRQPLFWRLLSGMTLAVLVLAAEGAVWHVGPGQAFAMPCDANAVAQDGDTVLIDAAGSYIADHCVWYQDNLTLRGVNGRPVLDAGPAHECGNKAIWVINGTGVVVDNIEFTGCKVVDGNGAGIRDQSLDLTVRHAYFHHNQNGILTYNNNAAKLTVEYSRFGGNDDPGLHGYTHNVYVGRIDELVFRYNWSYHAHEGHLLKSRAAHSYVLYNRLTGQAGGIESYELSFPNGGVAYVIGNLIQQPPTSPNSTMLDYLSEGPANHTEHRLFVVNNTFVNDYDTNHGIFVNIHNTGQLDQPAVLRNNIFWGHGQVTATPSAVVADHHYTGRDVIFVDHGNHDYHLLAAANQIIDAGTTPGTGAGFDLTPMRVYVHPSAGGPRFLVSSAIDIGAYEWPSDVIFLDGFESL